MTNITELIREDSPPQHHRLLPAACFFCSADVESGDVHVPGSTGEVWLHARCSEELALGLLRAVDWRRRSTRPVLVA
jgi:hypothetical protein